MKTIREKITFRIWKKGRKWIQCYFSFKHEGKENSVQGKVLITDYLKTKSVGEWVNNLPSEIQIKENSYTGKIEFTATPILTENPELPFFNFGKYKYENIKTIEEKDLQYLLYMKTQMKEGDVKDEIEKILSNYKIVHNYVDISEYYYNLRKDKDLNPSPENFEGYELIKQESYDDHDGTLVQRDIYKKLNIGGQIND